MHLIHSIHFVYFLLFLIVQLFPFLTLGFAHLGSGRCRPQLTGNTVQELYVRDGAGLLISPARAVVIFLFYFFIYFICLGACVPELFGWGQLRASVFALGRFTSRAVLAEAVLVRLVLEITVFHLGELLLMCYFLLAFGLHALIFRILGWWSWFGRAHSSQHFLLRFQKNLLLLILLPKNCSLV